MGVLNVTPDSFSDGGDYVAPAAAKRRVDELLDEGADVIDIGGESTRPGAAPTPPDVQIARIEEALVHAAVERRALVSVDTTCPEVAKFALEHGATVVNDVSCGADDELARVVARRGASLVLMHARGQMSKMAGFSDVPESAYGDVVADVLAEWSQARTRAERAGVPTSDILLDPGIGFMKSAAHSLALIRNLRAFTSAAAGIVVGPSRKSFIAKTACAGGARTEPSPRDRLGGTIAACLYCADQGADVLRVHDVSQVRQALAVHHALGGRHA
jgi:dihydropteroate synthase